LGVVTDTVSNGKLKESVNLHLVARQVTSEVFCTTEIRGSGGLFQNGKWLSWDKIIGAGISCW